MKLQDALLSAAPVHLQTTDGRIHQLKGADTLTGWVRTVPVRYVLDREAAELVANAA